MLLLTGGSFKLINMPGQLRNALPPPSFLFLGFSLVVKLSNLMGLGFLQPEAATVPGGLQMSPAVPLTSVADRGIPLFESNLYLFIYLFIGPFTVLGLTFIRFWVGETEVKKKGRQILNHSKMLSLACDRDAISKMEDSTISPSNKLQRKREDTKK